MIAFFAPSVQILLSLTSAFLCLSPVITGPILQSKKVQGFMWSVPSMRGPWGCGVGDTANIKDWTLQLIDELRAERGQGVSVVEWCDGCWFFS